MASNACSLLWGIPRPRSWTDEQLTAAVTAGRTLSEVHQRLGLRPGGYDTMRAHIARLGLEASHIPRGVPGDTRRTRRWTDADLAAAVTRSQSVHGVLRHLGYIPNGGMFRNIVAHIQRLGLDTSHFGGGRARARGRRFSRQVLHPARRAPRQGIHPRLVESIARPADRRRIEACSLCGVRSVDLAGQAGCPSPSTTSTATTPTTGWRTSVSCARTATPSPTPGAGERPSRCTPIGSRDGA